jgi:uncharacterized protein (DUF1501 family)
MALIRAMLDEQKMNTPSSPRRPSPHRLIFQPGQEPTRDVLVTIFLRGGIDGLTALPPLGDKILAKARGVLAVTDPGRGSETVELDQGFGLHAQLRPFEDLYRAGKLAIVPAAGIAFDTMSHFDAMKTLERGGSEPTSFASGWLGRYLTSEPRGQTSPLRAVAIDRLVPDVLNGTPALALPSLEEYRLDVPAAWSPRYLSLLERAYRGSNSPISRASRDIFRLLAQLKELKKNAPQQSAFPADTLGQNLQQVAQLIKANLGLEVATIDMQGWDTHENQGPAILGLMHSLAAGVRAFHDDLGEHWQRVTLLIYSEFGRRVQVNVTRGTDHGRATTLWVLGGGIRGGIYGEWPGTRPDQLSTHGSLRVTTDVRHVLAELLARRLASKQLAQVFSGFEPQFLGLAKTDA